MKLTVVPKGAHDWEKEFQCANLEREGTNELVQTMLQQFVAAAEHQVSHTPPLPVSCPYNPNEASSAPHSSRWLAQMKTAHVPVPAAAVLVEWLAK